MKGNIFLICLFLAFISSVYSASPLFAPYFDVTLLNTSTLPEVFARTGQKDFTLAFALGSHEGCVPKWGAMHDLDEPRIIDQIREIQAQGGEVVVATGGAMGPYLGTEHLCGTSAQLAAAYHRILDIVGTNHIDVDVEAPINNDMVNSALAQVQRERGTSVSFTLMVQGDDYGLVPDLGVRVLESAKANGVDVSIVNAMTMEYPSSHDWGDSVILAGQAVLVQMKAIWPEKSESELKKMLGITPMLGRNMSGRFFEIRHGRQLVDWANANNIGHLSFWSIARDNGNCAGGGVSPHCSSLEQGEFEFTNIYQGFHG